jgi:hypothetical protein
MIIQVAHTISLGKKKVFQKKNFQWKITHELSQISIFGFKASINNKKK